MNEDELGFQTWVLIGNTLHTLLRTTAVDRVTGVDTDRLRTLDEQLHPVQPAQVVSALKALRPDDRSLLQAAVEHAFRLAGSTAPEALGMDREEAGPVVRLLGDPHAQERE